MRKTNEPTLTSRSGSGASGKPAVVGALEASPAAVARLRELGRTAHGETAGYARALVAVLQARARASRAVRPASAAVRRNPSSGSLLPSSPRFGGGGRRGGRVGATTAARRATAAVVARPRVSVATAGGRELHRRSSRRRLVAPPVQADPVRDAALGPLALVALEVALILLRQRALVARHVIQALAEIVRLSKLSRGLVQSGRRLRWRAQ